MSHNHWACTLELVLFNRRSPCSEKPMHSNQEEPRSLKPEKARAQQRRPSAVNNKHTKKKCGKKGRKKKKKNPKPWLLSISRGKFFLIFPPPPVLSAAVCFISQQTRVNWEGQEAPNFATNFLCVPLNKSRYLSKPHLSIGIFLPTSRDVLMSKWGHGSGSWLLNVQDFCKPVVEPLAAWYQPWGEYLHHRNQ